MAIEDEEMKKRWEKRERLRIQRQKQQKRTIILLIVAAVVVLAVGILIFVMSRKNVAQPTQTQPAVTTPAPTTAPKETMGPDTTVIKITAAGDLNITDSVIASGGTNFNYTNALMDVVPLLSAGDITLINLEGNLAGAPYTSDTRSAPQSLADALKAAGVDFVQVANSWSLKNGIIGLNQTLSNLRLAGMEPLGAFSSNQEAKNTGGYTICTVKGVKVALVAFTKGMDSGRALPAGSENCVNVLYSDYESTYRRINSDGIRKILRAVQDEDPDIVVAMVHWGSEYNEVIGKTQLEIRDLMFAEGVNAIIGTHSHYVQSIEYDPKTGNFVAYSLGDFFGDGQRSGTAYSLVLELEITRDNRSGESKVTDYRYTPIYTTAGADGLLRVLRLEQAIAAYEAKYIDRVSKEVYEDMVYSLERVDKRIHAPAEEE